MGEKMEWYGQSYEEKQYKNTGEKDGEWTKNFRGVQAVKRILVLVTSENLGNWRRRQNPKHRHEGGQQQIHSLQKSILKHWEETQVRKH